MMRRGLLAALVSITVLGTSATSQAAGYWKRASVGATKVTQPKDHKSNGWSFKVINAVVDIFRASNSTGDTILDAYCGMQGPPDIIRPGQVIDYSAAIVTVDYKNPRKYAMAMDLTAFFDQPNLGGAVTDSKVRFLFGNAALRTAGKVDLRNTTVKAPNGAGKRSVYLTCGFGTGPSTYVVEYLYNWVAK
jgi:hypothetical protein